MDRASAIEYLLFRVEAPVVEMIVALTAIGVGINELRSVVQSVNENES